MPDAVHTGFAGSHEDSVLLRTGEGRQQAQARGEAEGGDTSDEKAGHIDNIVKIIADALNGLAYVDDTQIVDITAQKRYAEIPRVEVEIEEIVEPIDTTLTLPFIGGRA